MGTGFLKRKKEAKQLQEQLANMKNKMESLSIEGQAGIKRWLFQNLVQAGQKYD